MRSRPMHKPMKRYSDITGTNLVAETNHIYDSINRLTNIIHSNGANTISSYAQTYDAASKITSVTGTDGSSTYTYDDTNQLTGADYDCQADENYTYDSNGNRTNDGYVTGVNNQLLEDNKYLYEWVSFLEANQEEVSQGIPRGAPWRVSSVRRAQRTHSEGTFDCMTILSYFKVPNS